MVCSIYFCCDGVFHILDEIDDLLYYITFHLADAFIQSDLQ